MINGWRWLGNPKGDEEFLVLALRSRSRGAHVATAFIFDGLRMHLRARGMTYLDLARSLRLSEPTVKRIFSSRNCSLARLEAICEVLQIDLADLARGAPRESRLINRLSLQQEKDLMATPALLLVAVCAMHQMRLEEIIASYRISRAECLALLLRLEKIGFLEVHEGNRIRLRVSRTFAWIPNGPIMRYVKSQTADYFNHPFDRSGEFMRVINVRVSTESALALQRRLEQIAREFSDHHVADAGLPLARRQAMSVCLAVRRWEPDLFKAMRRRAA